jgi:hypothetical protein
VRSARVLTGYYEKVLSFTVGKRACRRGSVSSDVKSPPTNNKGKKAIKEKQRLLDASVPLIES